MKAPSDPVLAQTVMDLLPICDRREPVRVLVASLALGGAERIVLEWLGAEAARQRTIELAVLHPRRIAWTPPAGIALRVRSQQTPTAFLAELAEHWRTARTPVSVHLVNDELIDILWNAGVQTVPVVHNMRAGWRNDPVRWQPAQVPLAVACSNAVRQEMLADGCQVPVMTLRHMPAFDPTAIDPANRTRLRTELRVGSTTLLVAAVGAFKSQKDYARAIDVMHHLRRQREAVLLILGGALDGDGLAELDRVVSRACAAGLADHLRLPGFVQPIGPYYAAADVLLNVSRFEGFSMAVREALVVGLPVLATAVGGQGERAHDGLRLLPPDAPDALIAEHLAALPVRDTLTGESLPRAPRLWSLTTAWQRPGKRRVETLFVTANLNAGGAQRSLVNLVTQIAAQHPLAVAVCGETTQRAFADTLAQHGVETFRPTAQADPYALAESLLGWAGAHALRTLCFWNVDPKVKLLLARVAPAELRLIDVSPGHYAFAELDGVANFAAAIDLDVAAYYARLDVLVLKYHATDTPPCRRTIVIANGVATASRAAPAPAVPRFLVSGRIAPSKRLKTVLTAFAQVQRDQPTAELHLVGQAEARYAACLAELRVQASGLAVYFRGADPTMSYRCEPFTAAVVLGTHQGSPNAVLEAMAAGLPVIANASGGTGGIVRAGKTGWLLPEHCTAAELAAAMLESFAQPARSTFLGTAGRAYVRAHHDLEVMAARYLDLLKSPNPSRSR